MLAAAATSASAAGYLPVGPQLNVSTRTVTGGGGALCHSATRGTPFGNSAATTLADCGAGSLIMLAGRETGSDTLLVLAQTTKADAFNPTGAADNNVFTASNGADWFYNDGWSWGFKPIGEAFNKLECDGGGAPMDSMCVHTSDFVGGCSINSIIGLNFPQAYGKMVFLCIGEVTPGIPEPATWALLIAGFGLAGAAARRRTRAVSA